MAAPRVPRRHLRLSAVGDSPPDGGGSRRRSGRARHSQPVAPSHQRRPSKPAWSRSRRPRAAMPEDEQHRCSLAGVDRHDHAQRQQRLGGTHAVGDDEVDPEEQEPPATTAARPARATPSEPGDRPARPPADHGAATTLARAAASRRAPWPSCLGTSSAFTGSGAAGRGARSTAPGSPVTAPRGAAEPGRMRSTCDSRAAAQLPGTSRPRITARRARAPRSTPTRPRATSPRAWRRPATPPKPSSAAQHVHHQHGPRVRVADLQQPVVQVLLVRRERRPPGPGAPDHREQQVDERHGQHQRAAQQRQQRRERVSPGDAAP